ncbi:hypothetical protein BDV40DRAFT_300536 [Aspergillus tamarii]|uniref:Uncharacterized protein n=1 Tax=Aspergillus tamarii TaxID=41984 RepID=A0A5N6UUM9_ASPTM|nr:hypothetical protein BDV40DRAFT_300536 [Aspergillus tamarii]
MRDPFQKLPAEIIIQILESCWDFTSLDGLLQISSKANEVFDTYYPSITEAVLASCSMTLGFNGHKFRLIVAIQAAAIGPRTLQKFLRDKEWDPMPPVMESVFWSLECSDPIRQAIKSAAKVHRLACVCYDSFIEKIKKTKPARPNVNEDEMHDWLCFNAPVRATMPFPPDAIHHPSFVEQFWLHRALWAFELYSYIYRAATTRWNWSPKKLGRYTGAFLIFPNQMNWHEDEHLTITQCMRCLSRKAPIQLSSYYPWLIELPSPDDLVINSCRALPDPVDINDLGNKVDRSWGRGPGFAKFSGPGMETFRSVCLQNRVKPDSPLFQCDLRVFRGLGIAFWDEWRLYKMGLQRKKGFTRQPRPEYSRPITDVLYTWYSLVKDEDLVDKNTFIFRRRFSWPQNPAAFSVVAGAAAAWMLFRWYSPSKPEPKGLPFPYEDAEDVIQSKPKKKGPTRIP